MGADLASENDPYDHRDRDEAPQCDIRSPRPMGDDGSIDNLQKISPDEPAWWYDQLRKRGASRRYIGHVERIGGVEGGRLRADLTAVVRDLLVWAKQQTDTTPDARSNRKSGEDVDGDDAPT